MRGSKTDRPLFKTFCVIFICIYQLFPMIICIAFHLNRYFDFSLLFVFLQVKLNPSCIVYTAFLSIYSTPIFNECMGRTFVFKLAIFNECKTFISKVLTNFGHNTDACLPTTLPLQSCEMSNLLHGVNLPNQILPQEKRVNYHKFST